jgi:DNA-binding winged helix-turn-helix (wHTH) protein/tetratricopeptide (TPR) repeat protein
MNPSSGPASVVRFGVFEADLRAGELRKNGYKVKIQDLPFRTLKLLLNRPNEVVTREEFRQALWPLDIFVDFDRGISSAVKRLRDALGDSADNPIFVETIDRRGYRWIAPISIAPISISPTSIAQTSGAAVAPTQAPETNSELSSRSTPQTSVPPQSNPFVSWRLAYFLPVLALLFVIGSFRPGSHSAKAGGNRPRSSIAANTARHPANREAEDMYLQGRYYWNKRTPDDLHKAVDYFTQAIVHDPAYADAYVGLADCYNLLREYTVMPASDAYPRALAAAKKAVELDDQSSEAHASLAFVSFFGLWDVATADREFRRAIELDPNNAKAHHWYASFLSASRHFSESLTEIDRARELDPNSPSILADKGRLIWIAGRHEEGVTLLKQVEAADPDLSSPHRYLKMAYLQSGEYPNYLVEMKKEALLLHDPSALAVAEAAKKGFAAHGVKGMLEEQLREEQKLYQKREFSPYFLALTYSRLGKTQEALKYLEVSYTRHTEETLNLAIDADVVGLRGNPAIQQLLAKIGLPLDAVSRSANK